MRKFSLLLLTLSAVFTSAAQAQSLSSDIFGGFSYLRSDKTLIANNNKSYNFTGWEASYTLNLIPRLGILADFGGDYGPVTVSTLNSSYHLPMYQQHTFLAGPAVSLFKNSRFDLRLHALAGAAIQNGYYTELNRFGYDFERSTSSFGAAFGGNIDVHLTPHLSYRVIQPELILTRFGGSVQRNLRASTGVVYTFGGR